MPMRTEEHEGKSLHYVTVTPESYNPSRGYPAIILLHGFGANMYDLAGLAPALGQTGYLYLCPNGPVALDFGGGMIGYGWTPPNGFNDDDANSQALALLDGFMTEVSAAYRLTPGRVLLLGFSQGGMIAYQYALPRPDVFAGVAALSARLMRPEETAGKLPKERTLPVFIGHGDEDPVVPVDAGRESHAHLVEWGYTPEYHEYPGMAHEISEEELRDLAPWMTRVLPPLGGGLLLP